AEPVEVGQQPLAAVAVVLEELEPHAGAAAERARRRRREQVRHPRDHAEGAAVRQPHAQLDHRADAEQLVGPDEDTARAQVLRDGMDAPSEADELPLAPGDDALLSVQAILIIWGRPDAEGVRVVPAGSAPPAGPLHPLLQPGQLLPLPLERLAEPL